jgi:signal transduction histidine kinase
MSGGWKQEPRGRPTSSGLALRLPDGGTLLPVSSAGCLHLARAVLAGEEGSLAQAAWQRAALDPAVAAWLQAEGWTVADPLEAGRILPRLERAIVTAAGTGELLRAEAEVLRDAIAVAGEHVLLLERFEERVAEARLEAARELAYGAGHEINNPLANIAARAQALLLDEQDPERRRRLATIVDQAFRARDMIGGLMIFARPPRPQPAETNLDGVVRPAIEALAAQAAARSVRLEYSAAPMPLAVRVDATQVGEAIRMLLVNAVEAVADGGRVRVEASPVGVGGAAARILVDDDGPGMDAQTAARACDPFFSGREAGRGIGLGLPKARRLIESSGGTLAIESRPGQGTRCLVSLPVAKAAVDPSRS